jgi:hypothetical protein
MQEIELFDLKPCLRKRFTKLQRYTIGGTKLRVMIRKH